MPTGQESPQVNRENGDHFCKAAFPFGRIFCKTGKMSHQWCHQLCPICLAQTYDSLRRDDRVKQCWVWSVSGLFMLVCNPLGLSCVPSYNHVLLLLVWWLPPQFYTTHSSCPPYIAPFRLTVINYIVVRSSYNCWQTSRTVHDVITGCYEDLAVNTWAKVVVLTVSGVVLWRHYQAEYTQMVFIFLHLFVVRFAQYQLYQRCINYVTHW